MPKEPPPSRTAPQFVVRLPNEQFRERLAASAAASGRSINSEIVERLQASLDGDSTLQQILDGLNRSAPDSVQLEPAMKSTIEHVAKKRGVPPAQVVHEALLAGMQEDGVPAYYFHVDADATPESLRAIFDLTHKRLGKDARFILQQDLPVPKVAAASKSRVTKAK